MGEIHRPSALRFLQQDVDELLPHAAALVFAQAPVAGLRRGGDVVGQARETHLDPCKKKGLR